ncbi:MAG: hypothetical protein KJO79_02665 [Verrucomicrobiae bacterium]|nr:hypothetical protein [Verrucomicrobiae bacterium]NNJ86057.1 hypothetical protein [Akkermansiaceae bacterium]
MKLQVPKQMAGVTGPCPECSASITAPQPDSPAGVPTPQTPAQLPTNPVPQQTQQAQPQPQQTAGTTQRATQPREPNRLQSPTRKDPPGGNQAKSIEHRMRYRADDKPRARWMRVIFPLAFLVVAAALVLAVLQAVGMINIWDYNKTGEELISQKPIDSEAESTKDPETNVNTGEDATGPGNEATTDPSAGNSNNSESTEPTTPAVPVIKPQPEEGEFPELRLPPSPSDTSRKKTIIPPPPTTGIEPPPANTSTNSDPSIESSPSPSPPKAGFLANQTLDMFLKAKSLDERLPLMSKSRLSREELMASCLAGPLREIKSVRMVEMVPRVEDNMTQYLYFVAFEDSDSDRQRQRIVMQVVERPGVHPPRVHGDAFIEHYEKKFAKYAKHPNNDVTTFHCIAEARTADLAKDIPKELKKSMVRLVIKTHPYGAAKFDAYLSKNSPLMEHIGARKDFPYTEPRFCVLSFRWNTTDPNHPYIELNDIISQGWER